MNPSPDPEADILESATLDFALGEVDKAIEALEEAVTRHPGSFSLHHALAEMYFSRRDLDPALRHGRQAEELNPDDVHLHTSLSRIWMEWGDKEKAEQHGARARMLGWKEQLKEPPNPGASN